MRKRDYHLCVNKGADQLISAFVCATRIVLISKKMQKFKLLACYCDCIGRFVSELVGNPVDRFSRVAAKMITDIHTSSDMHFCTWSQNTREDMSLHAKHIVSERQS